MNREKIDGGKIRVRFSMLFVKFLGLFLLLIVLGALNSCGLGRVKGESEQLYLKALDAYSQQDFQKARELCYQIKKYDSNFLQAELLRIKSLIFLDEEVEAKKTLQSLVKKAPEFTDARLWYIRFLILQGDLEGASALIKQELVLNETDWRVHYLEGLINGHNQDYSQQLLSLQQAERALSDGAKVYLDLSRLWLVLGLEEQAWSQLEKAKTLVPIQGELGGMIETMETLLKNQEVKDEV